MVNIIINQGNYIVGITLAVAVYSRRGACGLYLVAMREQDNEQNGGSSSCGGGWNCDAPCDTTDPTMLLFASLCIDCVYLFYKMFCIHILFILHSFSLIRAMRVVTLVWLMLIIRPISSVENPSR